MTIYDIVKKLIGEIEPVGAEHVDKGRFENLEAMIDLVEKLHHDLDTIVYKNKDFHQDSIKRSCARINKYLDDMGIPED